LKSIASEKQPWVIFVTAYDQYAVRAFEEHALDCLPKPFDAALERAGLQLSKPEWGDVSCAMAPGSLFPRGKSIGLRRKETTPCCIAGGQTHLLRESSANLKSRLDTRRLPPDSPLGRR